MIDQQFCQLGYANISHAVLTGYSLFDLRVAVNVPVSELNPLKFSSSVVVLTKIAFPAMAFAELDVPFKINVPTSRQQVPFGNSTSPEKFIRPFETGDHTAGTPSTTDLSVALGSLSLNSAVRFAWQVNDSSFTPMFGSAKLTFHWPVGSMGAGDGVWRAAGETAAIINSVSSDKKNFME